MFRRAYLLPLLAAAALMAGCAADALYRKSQSMIAQGDNEAGMVKLQEALQLEPNNAQFRSAWIQTRDRTLATYQKRAEQAQALGESAEADSWYRRMLMLDAENVRARNGLAQLQREKRLADWQKEADAAWSRGDAAGAQRALRSILTEAPSNARALDLKRVIEEKTTRPPVENLQAAALRKPITIEFKDTTLKQVFEVLSRSSGLNFIFDKDVRTDQKTTVFLRNTTVESAVNMVLLTNQLEQRVLDANSILIYPNNAAKAREYQPLMVKTFFLANADVKLTANTIKTIIKTRDIVVDEKQNMIIMRDTPEAVRMAEKLVAMHDMPEPEVMLEVEVLEVNRTRLLNLGVQWPDQLVLSPLPTTSGGTVTLANLRSLSSNTIGLNNISTTINAKKVDGDANILANPRIRSRNKEKAKIMVGDRVPNITTTSTSTGFVSESVQYIDVGLKLEVEPTIYPDNEVGIKITMEVSTIANQVSTKSGTVAYQIGTRNATTVLRLKDGENQVLAGLISDEDRRTANKVPALGEIPVLGRLFGSRLDNTSKTEIVLSITPRLIRNLQRPDLASSEFEAGTEASLRSRGVETGGASTGNPAPANAAPGPRPAGVPAAAGAPGQPAPATSPGGPQPAPATSSDSPSSTPAGAGGGAAAASSVPAGSTSLAWESPPNAVVGSTFTMALMMQAGEPVTSVPLAIGYDAKLLEVVEVAEGTLLRQGSATNFSSRVDRATGQIFATVVRSAPEGATGSGSLVAVTFRAIGPAPEVRTQVLAVSPTGAGGKSVSVTMPAPQSLAISNP
jgi:general secretion pathway protein D